MKYFLYIDECGDQNLSKNETAKCLNKKIAKKGCFLAVINI